MNPKRWWRSIGHHTAKALPKAGNRPSTPGLHGATGASLVRSDGSLKTRSSHRRVKIIGMITSIATRNCSCTARVWGKRSLGLAEPASRSRNARTSPGRAGLPRLRRNCSILSSVAPTLAPGLYPSDVHRSAESSRLNNPFRPRPISRRPTATYRSSEALMKGARVLLGRPRGLLGREPANPDPARCDNDHRSEVEVSFDFGQTVEQKLGLGRWSVWSASQ